MSQASEPNPNAMTFEAFLLSLGTATLVALGEIDNPMTGKKNANADAARQHINILELLVQKTIGNLSSQEKKLLEDILFETRMKFVALTSKK
jgi:hypothetical protein